MSNGNGNGSRVVVRVADMAVVLPLLFSSLFFFFVLICVKVRYFHTFLEHVQKNALGSVQEHKASLLQFVCFTLSATFSIPWPVNSPSSSFLLANS